MIRYSIAGSARSALFRVIFAAAIAISCAFAAPAPARAADEPWLVRLNEFRAAAGLPAAKGNLAGAQGRWLHSRYQAMNGLLGHSEDPTNPWYTSEGALHTGNCCAWAGGAGAIDCWATAPFHAVVMLQPGTQSYGMSTFEQDGRTASTLECGWDWTAIRSARFPVRWPGPGSTVPYTSYWGGESPDPVAGSGYTNPIGLPIIIMFNSARTFSDSHLRCGGAELQHFVRRTGSKTAFVIPRRPLERGKTYDVEVTASGVAYRWSFTVGPRRTTAVSIAAPEVAAAGGQTSLSVRLTDGGLPSSRTLEIERSEDGSTWRRHGTLVTSSLTGSGTVHVAVVSPAFFRARFAGDDVSGASVSTPVRVDGVDSRVPTELHVDAPPGALVGSILTLHPWVEADGASIPWSGVVLERSNDCVRWTTVDRYAQEDLVGKPLVMGAEGFYRLRFEGDERYCPSVSSTWVVGSIRIGPGPPMSHRLALAPLAASSVKVGRSFRASGTLLPKHSRAPHAIRIQAFRLERGRWVWKRTWGAVSSDAAPDRFTSIVNLTGRGAWRIRAIAPADTAHTWGASAYKYVTAR